VLLVAVEVVDEAEALVVLLEAALEATLEELLPAVTVWVAVLVTVTVEVEPAPPMVLVTVLAPGTLDEPA
jgi:hypothetical protein